MFIPIGTDRPIRRRPRVVEVLIVLNMLIYLFGLASDVLGVGSFEAMTQWMQLSRGDFNVFSLFTYLEKSPALIWVINAKMDLRHSMLERKYNRP